MEKTNTRSHCIIKKNSKKKKNTYSRVKHATGHAVKRPYISSNGTAKSRRNEQQRGRIERGAVAGEENRLRRGEGEEEEHEGAAELGDGGHDLVSQRVRHAKGFGALDGIERHPRADPARARGGRGRSGGVGAVRGHLMVCKVRRTDRVGGVGEENGGGKD